MLIALRAHFSLNPVLLEQSYLECLSVARLGEHVGSVGSELFPSQASLKVFKYPTIRASPDMFDQNYS